MPIAESEPTRRALGLFVKLMRATRAVLAATETTSTVDGLTTTQFGVLEALLHKGRLSHGELKAKVLTSAANLTDVIDKLARRGLVTRVREAGDARRVCVELTASGQSMIGAAFPPHAANITGLMARLDAGEQAELARLLRKLGLEAEDATPR